LWTVLSPEIATAIDAFQDAIDQRMAEANGANQPKQPLFHYTSTPSLMAIVTSEQFWLTSIFHMDDTEELKFGFNVSRSLLQEAMASKVGLTRAFCQVLLKAFDAQRIKELIAFYSISFGLRDDTQQWNRYAAEGRGVALGLKPKFFSPVPFEDPDNPKPEEELFYGKVSYGEAEARARHSVVINGAFDLIDRAQTAGWLRTEEEGDTFCQHLAATMYTEILWNCVTTKDSSWSHQNETRILARNFLKKPRLPIVNAETRPRVELPQPLLRVSIAEVMIGLKAEAGALTRMRKFLVSRGLANVPVTRAQA
jgi:hypothetical protein